MAENSLSETSLIGGDSNVDVSSNSGSSTSSIDDVDLSLQGITLLMNDKWDEAEKLFNKYRDFSPMMSFGASFVMVMQGIMSFEDEKLHSALEALKDTERRCEIPTGFAKANIKKRKKKYGSLEDRLIRQIVTGDTLLYQSILIFINQDVASYIKGGWCLRKAWKLYEKTHREILQLHERAKKQENTMNFDPNITVPHYVEVPVEMPNTGEVPVRESCSSSFTSDCGSRTLVDGKEPTDLPLKVTTRLLGSSAFGVGVLKLVISLVPPKILKLIEFLGFDGDRMEGIKLLEIASNTRDMKAPLAMFALIWYHTVIRPFFAFDGSNLTAGIADAEVVIERCRLEYPDSALYLFFKARIMRLKVQIDEALATYTLALEKCTNQREIQLISVYEIGWLHMLMLNYNEAYKCFIRLRDDSRWSKCYYAYLSGICLGAYGDIVGAYEILKKVPSLQKRKNNQLETFVSKRAGKMKTIPTQEHLLLAVLELLYLWTAIPNCKKADLKRHLNELDRQTDKKIFHLRSLIEGAIYRELASYEMAIQCFEEAIARQQGMKEDKHVAAFASYDLGILLARKPETMPKAKKLLLQAKDHYKDYDFDNRLHVRVQAALHRIKHGLPI